MNDAYGITYDNLMRTLPDVLRDDDNMRALASAAAAALAALSEKTALANIYGRIDALPEAVLDLLAYDFKVDWWDADYTLEEKRRTLKDSWNVHRRLGTKAAVERAISAVYRDTQVSEWFEYGGEPYHFKLLIDATYERADPVKHRRVLARAEFYKNLRSLLDGIEYTTTPQGSCVSYAAAAAVGLAMEITAEVKVNGLG
jgi:phage tail P2-like protein